MQDYPSILRVAQEKISDFLSWFTDFTCGSDNAFRNKGTSSSAQLTHFFRLNYSRFWFLLTSIPSNASRFGYCTVQVVDKHHTRGTTLFREAGNQEDHIVSNCVSVFAS